MSSERIVFRSMIVLTAARIVAVLGVALSSGFVWMLVAVLFFEIVRTLSGPIYDTWLNLNIESKSRATVLSMMSQTDAIGQTAGGPFIGWIGHRYSMRAALVTAAVLLAPVLAVYARARQRNR
jgi:predicted MFS family arabinose efflux permease